MMNKNNFDASELNYVIYCRKSSDTEDRQVQSLETQYRELTEYAKRNNLNIVKIIQESKSAFKEGRQGFEEMRQLVKTKKANAILVVRANRISRNVMDSAYMVSLMDQKLLMYVRTPSSSCYTCFGNDKFMLGLEFIVSKKDSDDKGESVKEGLKTKALKGLPSGVASLGFINDTTEEKGNRKWKVDKERLHKIKILLDMFLTRTYSAGKLHKYAVNELKLTTVQRKKIGGAFIVLSRIYEILKDSIYAGFFFQGGERYELDENLPRLITEDQHKQILMILGKNNIPKIQKHQTIFSGFIVSDKGDFMGQDVKYQLICDCKNKFAHRSKSNCPKCGIKIDKLENPKYLPYTHYYNVRKKKAGEEYKSVSEEKIKMKLGNFVMENLLFSKELAIWSRQYIDELKNKEINEKLFKKVSAEADKEKFEHKKSRLREMLRDEQISKEEYTVDLSRLQSQYSQIDQPKNSVDWYSKMNEIIDLTLELHNTLENGTLQAKRIMLSKLGSNLVWNDKELIISNRKSINKLVEGIKLIKEINPKFEPRNCVVNKSSNEKTDEFSSVFSTWLRG